MNRVHSTLKQTRLLPIIAALGFVLAGIGFLLVVNHQHATDSKLSTATQDATTAKSAVQPLAGAVNDLRSQVRSLGGTPVAPAASVIITAAVGPRGLPGVPGSPGATGRVGAAGLTGSTGPKGDRGPSGPVGSTGASGPAGPAGSPAATHSPRPRISGPPGPSGADGPSGPAGPSGASGQPGSDAPTGPYSGQCASIDVLQGTASDCTFTYAPTPTPSPTP